MITAVVLAHNDEEILGRTLESLAWCDEVIVVDDNSTDNSREVAKKHKATVFKRKLNDDFAAQRNFGLGKAKNPWVLFVDSDEVVSPELVKEIKEVPGHSRSLFCHSRAHLPARQEGGNPVLNSRSPIRSRMTECAGYFVRRRDWMWGRELKHGETGNIKLLRLAKKDAGKWERPIHEVWNIAGEVGELSQPLHHYPHPNVAQFLKEINHYSTLRAKELFDAGVRVSWWQIVAYPKAKFLLNYFWRLGFLDRTAGAVHALLMSFHSFLVRAKLWKLWKRENLLEG